MTAPQTGTTQERWTCIQELFASALELPEAQREPFVSLRTQSDPEMREELLGLLACDNGQSTGPLTNALGNALDATTRDRRRALLGKVVGNYKLVSVLGHGGTGTVYLGERADRQYSAQVALKLVDTAAVQGDLSMRFRAERQILASLNHEHIARLLDAGETSEGQPYLVMEYVHGEPVDRYCDRSQLDVRSRLELFLTICGAVQFAHQNLVVHRDLKPANILVTAEGAAKLLDFGIAKLLDVGNDAAAALALTRLNDRLLTPEYASPEQILGRTVTTASDVYALGVVLYELLTGVRPYVVPGSASQLELERSICVSDPVRPSVAVRRAVDSGPTEGQSSIQAIATVRGVTADRLQRRLQGDIDAIIMRALRKEPQHRYSSVDQLVSDIRHHLANEPVEARQGNWLYYSQRFVRRHIVGVTVSAALVAFVIATAIVLSLALDRSNRDRQRAEQDRQRAEVTSEFMMAAFEAANPYVNFGKEPSARNLLENAARRVQTDEMQPIVRARLMESIGKSFRYLGVADRAVELLTDSVRIQRQLDSNDNAHLARVLSQLAIALRNDGKIEESDRAFAESLELSRDSRDQQSETHANLLVDLGRLEIARSNPKQAHQYFTDALSVMRRLRGPDDPEVGAILAELANVAVWSDDLEEGEKNARAAVEIYKSVPALHPDHIMADYRLASILLYRGRLSEAGPLFERALRAQRQVFGSRNSIVADTLASLAEVRKAQNNSTQAELLVREAISAHRDSDSKIYHKIGYLQTMLATILIEQQKFGEAEDLLRGALDLFAKSLPPDHQYVASAEHYLGECLMETGKLIDAEATLTAAMNRWKRTEAPPWRSARSASALGEVLYRENRMQDAERYLVSSFRVLNADQSADQDVKKTKSKARERISRFYIARGQRNKLDEILRKAASDEPAARGH